MYARVCVYIYIMYLFIIICSQNTEFYTYLWQKPRAGGRSSRTSPQSESGDWTPNVILIVLLVASMYIYPQIGIFMDIPNYILYIYTVSFWKASQGCFDISWKPSCRNLDNVFTTSGNKIKFAMVQQWSPFLDSPSFFEGQIQMGQFSGLPLLILQERHRTNMDQRKGFYPWNMCHWIEQQTNDWFRVGESSQNCWDGGEQKLKSINIHQPKQQNDLPTADHCCDFTSTPNWDFIPKRTFQNRFLRMLKEHFTRNPIF